MHSEFDESISCCMMVPECDPFMMSPKMRGYSHQRGEEGEEEGSSHGVTFTQWYTMMSSHPGR